MVGLFGVAGFELANCRRRGLLRVPFDGVDNKKAGDGLKGGPTWVNRRGRLDCAYEDDGVSVSSRGRMERPSAEGGATVVGLRKTGLLGSGVVFLGHGLGEVVKIGLLHLTPCLLGEY